MRRKIKLRITNRRFTRRLRFFPYIILLIYFKELKLFTAHPEATLAVANGTCDAQTQPLPNLAVVAKNQEGVFELVGPISGKAYMGWVTRPEDTDLRDYLSSKILEMRDKGIIDELQDKWFGFKMPIPSDGYLPEGAL